MILKTYAIINCKNKTGNWKYFWHASKDYESLNVQMDNVIELFVNRRIV